MEEKTNMHACQRIVSAQRTCVPQSDECTQSQNRDHMHRLQSAKTPRFHFNLTFDPVKRAERPMRERLPEFPGRGGTEKVRAGGQREPEFAGEASST